MVDDIKKEHEQQVENLENNDGLMPGLEETPDEDMVDVGSEQPVAEDNFMAEDDFLEDDFGADELEDEFFADDGFAEGDFGDDPYNEDDFGDDHPAAPVTKSGGGSSFLKDNFNYIIYGVGGLVGAYMIYATLFPSVPNQQQAMQPPAAQQQTAQQQAPNFGQPQMAPTENKAVEDNKPKGMLMGGLAERNTPNLAEQTPNRTAVVSPKTWQQPPMPTPISRDSKQAQDNQPKPVVAPPLKREPTAAPVIQPRMVKKEDSMSEPTPTTSPRRVAPTMMETTTTVDDAQVKALSGRIDQMEKNYSRLDNKLDKLTDMVEKGMQQKGSSVDNKELSRLEQKLFALENDMRKMAAKPAPQETARPTASRPAPVKATTASSSTVPKTAVAPRTYKNAPKTMQGVVPVQKPTAFSDAWVLRAAQTGVAWVSKDFSSPIQKVFIGQEVDGLGRVLAISVEQGRWVVETTEGKIVQ